MTIVNSDRIEKEIVLENPRSRVWRAITDVRQFNEWFGVGLTSPFAPGATVTGNMTMKGYEWLAVTMWIETMEPETRFAFRWHPGANIKDYDYSAEPTTLVTFMLEDADGGTKLSIVESGFSALSESRRQQVFMGNEAGWTQQIARIAKYIAANP